MHAIDRAAIINVVSGRPITAEAKCPSCFNPIERGWQWCHYCGYDPEGLNPAGNGPSPLPKGARPPEAPAPEPELFDPIQTIPTPAPTPPPKPDAVTPPFESVRSRALPFAPPVEGDEEPPFGPSGGGSPQSGPYAPPQLNRSSVRDRLIGPVGIVFGILVIIVVAVLLLFVFGYF